MNFLIICNIFVRTWIKMVVLYIYIFLSFFSLSRFLAFFSLYSCSLARPTPSLLWSRRGRPFYDPEHGMISPQDHNLIALNGQCHKKISRFIIWCAGTSLDQNSGSLTGLTFCRSFMKLLRYRYFKIIAHGFCSSTHANMYAIRPPTIAHYRYPVLYL